MQCAIDDCSNDAPPAPYCLKHLTRWIRYGDASVNKKPGNAGPAAALAARTVDGENGCRLWNGAVDGNGYGTIRTGGRSVGAHRLAYELAKGEIPTKFAIDHLCRVRLCVNPEHLEAVPHIENMRRAQLTSCRRGHPISDNGRRRWCAECRRVTSQQHRARSVQLRDSL